VNEPIYQDVFLRQTLRALFWLGISACAVIGALTAALVVLALRPKLPPYIVAVDHGKIVGYTQEFKGDNQLGEAIIIDKVREFIYAARAVTPNYEFELRNIDIAYAMARGQATHWLDAHLHGPADVDPMKLAHKGDWRDVDITRVLKESTEGSYRVEWTETDHPHWGEPTTSSWEATLRVLTGSPDTRTDLNPIGLYVIALDVEEAK
jgi:type IV secretory pathway TrbF-like protein